MMDLPQKHSETDLLSYSVVFIIIIIIIIIILLWASVPAGTLPGCVLVTKVI